MKHTLSMPEFQLSSAEKTTFTAIPNGAGWSIKAIDPWGKSISLPGVFDDRLHALGAAVLMAERYDATVRP